MAKDADTPYQDFIIAEMAELTGRTDLTGTESFLDTGGDSLRAILLASAVEERYGVVLDLVDVFEADSLRAIGVRVGNTARAAVPDPR